MQCTSLWHFLFSVGGEINWRRIFKVWRGREISNYYLSITNGFDRMKWDKRKEFAASPLSTYCLEVCILKEEIEAREFKTINYDGEHCLGGFILSCEGSCVSSDTSIAMTWNLQAEDMKEHRVEWLKRKRLCIEEARQKINWRDFHFAPNSLESKNSKQHKKLCSAIVHDLSLQSGLQYFFKYLYNLSLCCLFEPAIYWGVSLSWHRFHFISLLTS